jgi:putative chitinase
MSRSPAEAWAEPLDQAMAAFGIDTVDRASMFLANVAHESRELTALEENLSYRPARLLEVFPRHFKDLAEAERYSSLGPAAIASRVYANRLGNGGEISGDGWTYRARGPIGVTFKSNYMACSVAICGDADTLLKNPEFLRDPEFGAASAGWYWDSRDCNARADAGDFDGVCDLINIGRKTSRIGDSNGFDDRVSYLRRIRAALS